MSFSVRSRSSRSKVIKGGTVATPIPFKVKSTITTTTKFDLHYPYGTIGVTGAFGSTGETGAAGTDNPYYASITVATPYSILPLPSGLVHTDDATTVEFDSVHLDGIGTMAATGNNYITIVKDGYYLLSAFIPLKWNDINERQVYAQIIKNDSNNGMLCFDARWKYTSWNHVSVHPMTVEYLTAGDQISVRIGINVSEDVYVSDTTTGSTDTGPRQPYLQVMLLSE